MKSAKSCEEQSLVLIGLALGIDPSLLFLIYVWQGLFGGRPLGRMIKQHRHFLQLIKFGAGLDQDFMSLCGRARLYLDNFTNA